MTEEVDIPVDRLQERLLPLADLFMMLAVSRPESGTLRTTLVTRETIFLGIAVAVVVGLPGVYLVVYGLLKLQLQLAGLGLVGTLIGAGSALLAVFGIRQRLLMRRA